MSHTNSMFQVLSDVIYLWLRSHKINTHISLSLSKHILCSLCIYATTVFQCLGIKIELYGFQVTQGYCFSVVRQNSSPLPVNMLNVAVFGFTAKQHDWRGNGKQRMMLPDTLPQKMLAFTHVWKACSFLLLSYCLGKTNTSASLHLDWQCFPWYSCRVPNLL